jgi:cytidyltransferase-like protein
MSKTIVINSGYFNPIHPGHIECMDLSKQLGDELWIIVNNDKQAENKRGVPSFQNENFRIAIVQALKYVDQVFLCIDQDSSVCQSLVMLSQQARDLHGDKVKIIFAKGGDRNIGEVPESQVCRENNIRMIDGLGAKTHNSSDFIKKIIKQKQT